MRYLPLTDTDRQDMLTVIGASSVDDLFVDVPAEARLPGKIAGLPDHASELAVERHMAALARKNLSAGEEPFFLGAGAYSTGERRVGKGCVSTGRLRGWRDH